MATNAIPPQGRSRSFVMEVEWPDARPTLLQTSRDATHGKGLESATRHPPAGNSPVPAPPIKRCDLSLAGAASSFHGRGRRDKEVQKERKARAIKGKRGRKVLISHWRLTL